MTTTTQEQQPKQQMPANGSIAHTEWSSTDVAGTRKFLGSVFGWTFEDMPSPDGSTYAMISNNKVPVGGLTEVMKGAPGPGQTPYVAVEDLGATTKKVTDNGGTVVAPETEVPGMGKFAVYQGPGGSIIAAWQGTGDGN